MAILARAVASPMQIREYADLNEKQEHRGLFTPAGFAAWTGAAENHLGHACTL
jgi:hypothetical protein